MPSRVEPTDEEKGEDEKTEVANPHAAFVPVAEVSVRAEEETAAEEETVRFSRDARFSVCAYSMRLLGYPWYAALRWTCPDCSAPGKEGLVPRVVRELRGVDQRHLVRDGRRRREKSGARSGYPRR